jgi:superfamily II DNA/RNA helicase
VQDKLLLYTKFTLNFPLIILVCFCYGHRLQYSLSQKIFNAHDIPCKSILGQLTPAQRQKVLMDFNNPDSAERVLLCSDVGSTGLNIQAANIIFLIVCDFFKHISTYIILAIATGSTLVCSRCAPDYRALPAKRAAKASDGPLLHW